MAENGREARPSTDQESAPLLQGSETEDDRPSFARKITSIVQEPLSPLTKVLLVAALWLLILSSVFIGLFAGAQHKLNTRLGAPDGDREENPPPGTVTLTATDTTTATATATATTTDVSTAISTATSIVTSTDISTTVTTAITTSISTSVSTTTFTTTEIYTKTAAPPLPGPTHRPPSQDTCFSPDCVILSASILSSLDTSVDPCENFYDFANGGWLKAHPLPADKGIFGNFNLLSQQNQQVIREILESDFSVSAIQSSYDAQILRKLRGLYSSCMNETELNERGEEPLKHFVKTLRRLYRRESTDITGASLDLVDGAEQNGLTAAIAFLHSRGINALFSFEIEGDVGVNPNWMTVWFSQPELGLPSKEYYEDEPITTLYGEVIQRLLLTLSEDREDHPWLDESSSAIVENKEGGQTWPPWPWPPWDGDDDDDPNDDDNRRKQPLNQTEKAHKLSQGVVEFEKRLANASLDLDILYQDPIATYNPRPISNLTKTLTQIEFIEYFSTLTPRAFPRQVIITYPEYPVSLSEILDSTSSDVIEAYLVTRAALTLSPHLGLDTEAWQAVRSLDETLKGIKKGAVGDRSEYCVGKVESAMGFAAGRYFVNETFGGESREKGTKVITDIIQAFKASLPKIEWMDRRSAGAAAQKADAIRVKVGFPLSPDTLDAASIARYYSLVKINEHTFFENMLSAYESDVYKGWQQLAKPRDSEAWEMYPSMVNAYFNPPANEIVFPAGILQPPFFSQDWPAYLSYGSFGHVASHELTHAFDSAGRMYNQQGKLEQWWSDSTSEGFQVRQDCIEKQYSSYWVDDGKGGRVYVNGNLTSGENIGDTGLIQAYRAWNAQYELSYEVGHEYLLPGLNYTREQLFFISFARAWAQNIKPASAVQRVRTDPHSPNQFRVDGTLYNIPEFAQAFNCPADAKLNPPQEKRCILW